MALLYADENFRYSVAEEVRLLEHDVLTVAEAGQQGSTDAYVFQWVTRIDLDTLERQFWDDVKSLP